MGCLPCIVRMVCVEETVPRPCPFLPCRRLDSAGVCGLPCSYSGVVYNPPCFLLSLFLFACFAFLALLSFPPTAALDQALSYLDGTRSRTGQAQQLTATALFQGSFRLIYILMDNGCLDPGPCCPWWRQAASRVRALMRAVHALMRAVHACSRACRACCVCCACAGQARRAFLALCGAAAWAAVMGWWQQVLPLLLMMMMRRRRRLVRHLHRCVSRYCVSAADAACRHPSPHD